MSALSDDLSSRDTVALNTIRTGPRDGATVVLIHSVGLDLTYWDRQIEALSATCDVVAFDLPGHGRSAGVSPDWRFDDVATSIAALIGRIGKGPVHVIGLSAGAMIAEILALSHPHAVRSLTLIGGAASFPDAARAGMRAHADALRDGGMQASLPTLEYWVTADTIARRPDLMDRITKTLLRNDASVYASYWDRIASFDTRSRLAEIQCPTRVLVGARDPNTPPELAAALAEGIRGARHVVIADASHMSPLEQPAAINAEILGFLAELA